MAKKKKQVYSTMFRATPHLTKEGTYRIQVTVGKDDATGKSIIKSFTGATPFEAVKMAEDYISGKREETENMTVGQAIDKYIEMKENVLSPTTVNGYYEKRRNCLQSIMNIPLCALENSQIQIAINKDSAHLSPKTVRNAYCLLSAALKMFRPDFMPIVTLPAKQHKVKDLPAVDAIIRAIRGTDVELPCLLAMWLSLRMSEVLGIRYSDISGNTLTIRQTVVHVRGERIEKTQTKTFNSTRQLQIPAYIMKLIAEEKSKSDSEYLITMSGNTIYKHFVKLLARENLPHMTFHDLRHMNASVMLMLGVPDKYAMERGGWASNYTLKNVYQHTFSEKRKEIDKQIDQYFDEIITEISRR